MFRKIEYELFWDMAHWLGKKYKLNMPAIMKRFREGNTLRTKTVKLARPTEYKAKRFVAKTWYNPYTEKDKVKEEKDRIKRESLFSYNQIWIGNEDRQGKGDLREEAILLKGTTCTICGKVLHPSEVQVDHIVPYARFKNPQDADRIGNVQILCTEHHRAKTKIDPKVLSRMR
jgi:5-methylcytosine-specific restriction endonuclease McrA